MKLQPRQVPNILVSLLQEAKTSGITCFDLLSKYKYTNEAYIDQRQHERVGAGLFNMV
jgi:hypothetical protein